MHVAVIVVGVVIFTNEVVNLITSNIIIDGVSVPGSTRTLTIAKGLFDASSWDNSGKLNIFPNMGISAARTGIPGSVYYLAIHNEVVIKLVFAYFSQLLLPIFYIDFTSIKGVGKIFSALA